MRENGEYQPSNDELKHIQAVLQLLNIMDKDQRFETAVSTFAVGRVGKPEKLFRNFHRMGG